MIPNNEQTSRWISGIPYEIAFWNSYYSNKKRRSDLFSWSGYGKKCELENFDIDGFIGPKLRDESPIIVDAGAALSYVFGTVISGKEVKIDYVDPLAIFYNRILDRYDIDRPRIKFGMVESLSVSYPENSVTFVHIRNALDHCYDPIQGIIQALVILKRDGVLYLNHFKNEAEREGYRGFHQYNIKASDGNLILWNRDVSINVNDVLGGFANVEVSETKEGRVVAVITKFGSVPARLYDSSRTVAKVADMFLDTISYFDSPSRSLSYHWKKIYTNIGHKIMRLMPFSVLNRIKEIASKIKS